VHNSVLDSSYAGAIVWRDAEFGTATRWPAHEVCLPRGPERQIARRGPCAGLRRHVIQSQHLGYSANKGRLTAEPTRRETRSRSGRRCSSHQKGHGLAVLCDKGPQIIFPRRLCRFHSRTVGLHDHAGQGCGYQHAHTLMGLPGTDLARSNSRSSKGQGGFQRADRLAAAIASLPWPPIRRQPQTAYPKESKRRALSNNMFCSKTKKDCHHSDGLLPIDLRRRALRPLPSYGRLHLCFCHPPFQPCRPRGFSCAPPSRNRRDQY
jgi:hypothetical protein